MTLILEKNVTQLLQDLDETDIIAVDTETFGLRHHEKKVVGLALSWEYEDPIYHRYYLPFRHDAELGAPNLSLGVLDFILGLLKRKKLIFHNAKFDLAVLENEGHTYSTEQWYDTQLIAYLLDENRFDYKLKGLARELLGAETNEKLLLKLVELSGGWSKVPPEGMEPYACNDGKYTWQLFHLLYPKLQDEGLLSLLADMQEYSETLRETENNGLKLDIPGLREAYSTARKKQERLEEELGFNPRGRKALAEWFDDNGIEYPLTKKGNPNIDRKFLDSLDDPRAGLLKEWRTAEKAASTYYGPWVEKADEEGRVHPSFKQFGTKTGRLSCEEPNLQQIPREESDVEVKKYFRVTPGYELYEFDYSQVEFILAVAYGKEEDIIQAIKDGLDVHNYTASRIGIKRYPAKTLNYSVLYGGGAPTLAKQLGVPAGTFGDTGNGTAAGLLSSFRELYPGIFKASKQAEALARRGKLKNWCGRKRRFRYPTEHHKAFNSLIQGGAADILRQSLVSLHRDTNYVGRSVAVIHDSLLAELPIGQVEEQIELVRHHFCDWSTEAFGVPFSIDAKHYKGASIEN